MRIVIASRNPGKISEIREILAHPGIEFLSLSDFSDLPPIIETGKTFQENALLKAEIVSRHTNMWTLADDSGLEVEALNGAPGVNSARYASENASDQDNINKLLDELRGIAFPERHACFRAVVVLMNPQGEQHIAEGEVRGMIAETPCGELGFGYDPVFYLPHYHKTMAELPVSVKNYVSHRAEALEQLKKLLDNLKSRPSVA